MIDGMRIEYNPQYIGMNSGCIRELHSRDGDYDLFATDLLSGFYIYNDLREYPMSTSRYPCMVEETQYEYLYAPIWEFYNHIQYSRSSMAYYDQYFGDDIAAVAGVVFCNNPGSDEGASAVLVEMVRAAIVQSDGSYGLRGFRLFDINSRFSAFGSGSSEILFWAVSDAEYLIASSEYGGPDPFLEIDLYVEWTRALEVLRLCDTYECILEAFPGNFHWFLEWLLPRAFGRLVQALLDPTIAAQLHSEVCVQIVEPWNDPRFGRRGRRLSAAASAREARHIAGPFNATRARADNASDPHAGADLGPKRGRASPLARRPRPRGRRLASEAPGPDSAAPARAAPLELHRATDEWARLTRCAAELAGPADSLADGGGDPAWAALRQMLAEGEVPDPSKLLDVLGSLEGGEYARAAPVGAASGTVGDGNPFRRFAAARCLWRHGAQPLAFEAPLDPFSPGFFRGGHGVWEGALWSQEQRVRFYIGQMHLGAARSITYHAGSVVGAGGDGTGGAAETPRQGGALLSRTMPPRSELPNATSTDRAADFFATAFASNAEPKEVGRRAFEVWQKVYNNHSQETESDEWQFAWQFATATRDSKSFFLDKMRIALPFSVGAASGAHDDVAGGSHGDALANVAGGSHGDALEKCHAYFDAAVPHGYEEAAPDSHGGLPGGGQGTPVTQKHRPSRRPLLQSAEEDIRDIREVCDKVRWSAGGRPSNDAGVVDVGAMGPRRD